MQNKIILFLIIILTTFCSCKKRIVSDIFNTTKNYCEFNKNSYWIYQDSVSTVIDSVVLISNTKNLRENSDYNVNEKIILLEFEHFFNDTSFITKSKIESSYKGIQSTSNYYSGDFVLFDTNNFTSVYSIAFSLQKITNSIELIGGSIYEELILNNVTYKDVIVYNTSAEGNALVVYWSKEIGIIRYEIKDKTVNLICYSVV